MVWLAIVADNISRHCINGFRGSDGECGEAGIDLHQGMHRSLAVKFMAVG